MLTFSSHFCLIYCTADMCPTWGFIMINTIMDRHSSAFQLTLWWVDHVKACNIPIEVITAFGTNKQVAMKTITAFARLCT